MKKSLEKRVWRRCKKPTGVSEVISRLRELTGYAYDKWKSLKTKGRRFE